MERDPGRGIEVPQTDRMLRITEAAAEVGLTPRAIRYYEEIGLLRPAARSDGDYRLYDPSDVSRLRFIRALRDDAGFSLAEIGRLLEDEEARALARERFQATADAGKRRSLALDTLGRTERRIATLREKAGRLGAMIEEAEARRAHLLEHLAELEQADR